jgi:hypothetical protein
MQKQLLDEHGSNQVLHNQWLFVGKLTCAAEDPGQQSFC